ncbi:hypothetical protein EMPS_09539 [Entomortierella parvispora]|uniref:FAD-binding domain-containing protein n=1 Tax=Entomortierella parvispora TaxID=205924 RepID=A0A9P3HIH0_9FUNG|nr:hypothetical protein EMPS_09539 [Entomortierella parvispora]
MNPHRARGPVDEFDESTSRHPSQFPPASDGKNPFVLIVGAGIGGLFLAILLERAGIPYQVFERAPEVKALGSVLGINANILPVFEQLGFYEEFQKIALPLASIDLRYGNNNPIAKVDIDYHDLIGYNYMMFARPRLYDFFLSKIPAERIHFGKKVMSILQNRDGAMIRCSDGTTYHGDILVGADGAYSAVRQSLFKQLQEKSLLPQVDTKELNKGYTCLVGTTNSLSPEKYPIVAKSIGEQFQYVVQGTPYTWSLFNVPENRLCYVVVQQYASKEEAEEETFRNSEWGPEKSGSMIEKVKDFLLPFGSGTLGDLIDETPRDKISRVFLENKLFETWTHGRTVLIGDAVHKLLPSGAQGAVCAMQDAVILANCLYDLKSLKHESIEEALQDYKQQRYSQVKVQDSDSNVNATLFFGQTMIEKCIRHIVFNWLPKSLMSKTVIKDASYRPQVAFLPLAPIRGSGPVLPQKPSWRYEKEQKLKREEEDDQKRARASEQDASIGSLPTPL